MLLGLYSLSGRTPYHKISWRLDGARFGFRLFPIALLIGSRLRLKLITTKSYLVDKVLGSPNNCHCGIMWQVCMTSAGGSKLTCWTGHGLSYNHVFTHSCPQRSIDCQYILHLIKLIFPCTKIVVLMQMITSIAFSLVLTHWWSRVLLSFVFVVVFVVLANFYWILSYTIVSVSSKQCFWWRLDTE